MKELQGKKKILVGGSKRGRSKKRWERGYRKGMLARGLKRNDAQDHAVWKLGGNPPSLVGKQVVSRKMKLIVITPGTNK